MALATVSLTAAMICFQGACHPALVGKDTPVGTFPLTQRIVQAEGYGGDVLQFKETAREVFAVHRVWLGNPAQHRLERLRGPAAGRRGITGGCINVAPEVYDALIGMTELKVTW
ncbi:hypothetical protein [Variovorax sp. Varisp36]|jgi:hypothetical protein|uniref:hypothetical protein n=1 Tax=Variovorax sp. Varisp36 TaxID=3243031 RepID=UPI0039A4953F